MLCPCCLATQRAFLPIIRFQLTRTVKTVIEYPYSYFKIFHMWGSAGSIWKWDMDYDQLADAAFYKGSMRIHRAYDRAIEGTIFSGFFEFRRASPQLSWYLQFQLCVNARAMLIRPAGKLPPLIPLPGIGTPNDSMDALRQAEWEMTQ